MAVAALGSVTFVICARRVQRWAKQLIDVLRKGETIVIAVKEWDAAEEAFAPADMATVKRVEEAKKKLHLAVAAARQKK
jgi:hypothetical protein